MFMFFHRSVMLSLVASAVLVTDFQWVTAVDIDDANLEEGEDIDIVSAAAGRSSGAFMIGGHARTEHSGCEVDIWKAFLAECSSGGAVTGIIDSDHSDFFPSNSVDADSMEKAWRIRVHDIVVHTDAEDDEYAYVVGSADLAWSPMTSTIVYGSVVMWVLKFDIANGEGVELQVIGKQPGTNDQGVSCISIGSEVETADVYGYGIDMSGDDYVVVCGSYVTHTGTVNFETGDTKSSDGDTVDMFILTLEADDLDPVDAEFRVKASGETAYADVAYDVATDSSGDAYITGYFATTVLDFGSSITVDVTVGTDFFVAKYDINTSGVLSPADALGIAGHINGGDDSGNAIATDGDLIFITGYFTGTVVADGPSVMTIAARDNAEDAFVLAYEWDSGLDPIWGRWAGNQSTSATTVESGEGIAVTTDGVVVTSVLFGHDLQTSDATPVQESSAGGDDIFVWAHTGTTGAFQWSLHAGGDDDDVPFAVGSGGSGDAVVVGSVTKPSSGNVDFGSSQSISGSTITDVDGFVTHVDE